MTAVATPTATAGPAQPAPAPWVVAETEQYRAQFARHNPGTVIITDVHTGQPVQAVRPERYDSARFCRHLLATLEAQRCGQPAPPPYYTTRRVPTGAGDLAGKWYVCRWPDRKRCGPYFLDGLNAAIHMALIELGDADPADETEIDYVATRKPGTRRAA